MSSNVLANTLVGKLKLSGRVYKSSFVSSSKKVTYLKLNYNHYLEYTLLTGVKIRKTFKINEVIKLNNSKIKTVVIYAP